MYTYIDNWYAQAFIRNGVIFFLTFVFLWTMVSRKSVQIDQSGVLTFILFVLALQCIIQDSILCIYYNTFVFLIGFYSMNSIKDIIGFHKDKVVCGGIVK